MNEALEVKEAGAEETGLDALALAATTKFPILKGASDVRLISQRENAVFAVSSPLDQKQYVLRVHRDGYQSKASIRSELDWMAALKAAGVDTPDVVEGDNQDPVQIVSTLQIPEGRICDVLAWVEGEDLASAGEEAGVLESYRMLGSINAKLHVHARGFVPPQGFDRQSWDEEGMLGADPLWGDFRDLGALTAEQLGLLERARVYVLEYLDDFGKSGERFGLIHADMMPENILLRNGEPYVIDFDDSGYGWYLYDAATLFAFEIAEEDYADRLAAWIEGYREVTDLSEEDLSALDIFIMCRFLVGLGWLHTRQETDMAKEATGDIVELAIMHANKVLAR